LGNAVKEDQDGLWETIFEAEQQYKKGKPYTGQLDFNTLVKSGHPLEK